MVGMKEASKLLDVSAKKTLDLVRQGLLESYMEGNRRKVTTSSIHDYIARKLDTATRIKPYEVSDDGQRNSEAP